MQLAGGPSIEVYSVRLLPAVFRIDLGSPDCWREHAETRRRSREQLPVIASLSRLHPGPVILGGYFNAPQGDAVFRVLRPEFTDAFTVAG